MSWSCQACTFSNGSGRTVCEVCDAPNPHSKQHNDKESKLEEKKTPLSIEPSDDEIMAQQDRITAEIAKSQQLVGKLQTFQSLEDEYKDSPKFLKKIQEVAKKYSNLRRIRGDGNCFYRAYLFGCLESIRENESRISEFAKYILASLDRLENLGFSRLTLEDGHDFLIDVLNWLKTGKRTNEELALRFNDEDTANYLVMYIRILTSAQLQTNPKLYGPYLDGKVMSDFIKQDVEGMGKECDHVQCVALANEIGIPVRIEYADPTDSSQVAHTFPDKKDPKVFLLYRPGHYDVIYPKV